ncbi:DUF2332 domain-containing protein [Virgibacillus halophilus]|uniref:DUF2332 domain-containing protein n=1 Tax=Tigheibacillus halophilus TaxID=361280 RepID=UPI0036458C05
MGESEISRCFKLFAENECKGSCSLYENLSQQISEDQELLELAANARQNQPAPNLFFGAVQYLLFKGSRHELSKFYSSIVRSPGQGEKCFPHFKNFCQHNRSEIIALLKEKLVQTNEVRRCGYLYPVFCFIHRKMRKPLALMEIGTSAGLQLLWDKYCYTYGDERVYGSHDSDVKIKSEVKHNRLPLLLNESPQVASRLGFDLHVNDLHDPEDYLWLKSLIWPNHHERRALFEKAVYHVRSHRMNLIQGDGVQLLLKAVKNIPQEELVCVFHTHTANQFSTETKSKLLKDISTIGQERDICHVYNHIQDRKLHLDYYVSGKEYNRIVGETDGHGRWFSWYLSDE